MTSKNSYSNRLLPQGTLHRNLWSIVLSGLAFFFSLLLPTLMQIQNALTQMREWGGSSFVSNMEERRQSLMAQVGVLLGRQNVMVSLAFVVLAIVCGLSAFTYLHSRKKVDFYHSLPISRGRLFAGNYLTGIVCVLPMYLVMLGITVGCTYALGFGEAVNWGVIGMGVLTHCICFLLIYALSALTAILCGNTIISLLLLIWVQFSAVVLGVMISGVGEIFLQHYSHNFLNLTAFSPIVPYLFSGVFFGYSPNAPQMPHLWVYAVAVVVVTAIAFLLFRIRKSERAGSALAFEPLKAPLKFFMCLFVGTLGGLLFWAVGNMLWFWVGLVIMTVIFHAVVEIIYAFDFRALLAKPLQLVMILAVLFGGMLCVHFDVLGYDRWLPAERDIAAACVDWLPAERDIAAACVDQYHFSEDELLETPENIAAVRRLAEIGIATDFSMPGDYSMREVSYQMKSGRIATRSYYFHDNDDEVQALLLQIANSAEYKQKNMLLFQFDETDVSLGEPRLDIHTGADYFKDFQTNVTLSNAAQVHEILETLREETLARTEQARPVMLLELSRHDAATDSNYYDGSVYVTVADTRTLALLKQYANAVPQTLSPADAEVYVTGAWEERVTDPGDVAALLENGFLAETLNLYGDVMEYGMQLRYGTDNAGVRVLIDGAWMRVAYLADEVPTYVIEKYTSPLWAVDTNGEESAIEMS